jgi:hypothetical protein
MKGENMKWVFFFSDLQQFKKQFGKIYKCGLMAKIVEEKNSHNNVQNHI